MQEKIPLLIIEGQTASGKSALAERLMEKFSSSLVNGDAQQIYRGLEIITAAPREQDNTFLFSFKGISEAYSFVEYVADADAAIAKIWGAGRMPVLVGGSGLYIDALVNRPITPPKALEEIRTRVKHMSAEEARTFLQLHDPAGYQAIDTRNARRVQRAVEILLQTGKSVTEFRERGESPYMPIKIGWKVPPAELQRRIRTRIEAMWHDGAVEEVRRALEAGHALTEPGMHAIGVPEIAALLRGELTDEGARELLAVHTSQYAKRQMTWFKKDTDIVWYNSFDDVWHSVRTLLPKNFNPS